MIYAFDTDMFSLLVRGQAKVALRYRELVTVDEHVFTVPAVVRIELLQGRFASITKAADGEALLHAYELLERTEQAIRVYRILPITQAVADSFTQLRADKKLKKAGVKDLLIASIALAHGATLATRNSKDFALVAGLKLDNWAD